VIRNLGKEGSAIERLQRAVEPLLRAADEDGLMCALFREAAFGSSSDYLRERMDELRTAAERWAVELLREAHDSKQTVASNAAGTVSVVCTIVVGWCVLPAEARLVTTEQFVRSLNELIGLARAGADVAVATHSSEAPPRVSASA